MATKAQEVGLTLLDEIDEFCERTGCSYFLSEKTALFACRSGLFETGMPVPSVLMTLPDVLKFVSYVESERAEDRAVESLLTNPNYDSFSFSYCDTGTTLLPLNGASGRDVLALRVRIVLLRQAAPSKTKRYANSFYTKGWIYNRPSYKNKKKVRFIKRIGTALSASLIKHDKVSYIKHMFKHLEESQEGISMAGRLRTENMRDEIEKYREGLFASYKKVELEGHSYRVPRDVEVYLERHYGANWATRTFQRNEVIESEFVDTEMPYKFALDYFKSNDILPISSSESKEEKRLRKQLLKYNKKIDKPWHVVLRTGARFSLWLEYREKKDEILSLHQAGDWEALDIMLSRYDEVARTMLNLGQGVCFDPDILECYLSLLSHKGEEKLANKINKLIPEEHRVCIPESVLSNR